MSTTHERWTPHFHLAPRKGWLNDPNGLCQFHGTYHVFYQADPAWPAPGKKGWGHFASRDLVRWEDLGEALMPSIPEDADGVYSGSALVVAGSAPNGGDLLRLYYTGNVKYEGDHVHTGRDANEIMVTSEDGISLSDKEVLLRPEDYPSDLTRHVRDPKVWEQATSRATCATPRSGSRTAATTWCWAPVAQTTWATLFSTSQPMPWRGRTAGASSLRTPLATCGSAQTLSS